MNPDVDPIAIDTAMFEPSFPIEPVRETCHDLVRPKLLWSYLTLYLCQDQRFGIALRQEREAQGTRG